MRVCACMYVYAQYEFYHESHVIGSSSCVNTHLFVIDMTRDITQPKKKDPQSFFNFHIICICVRLPLCVNMRHMSMRESMCHMSIRGVSYLYLSHDYVRCEFYLESCHRSVCDMRFITRFVTSHLC